MRAREYIDEARHGLDRGERDRALEALLAAWRLSRAEPLAALIDALGVSLASTRPEVGGR